MKCPKCDKDFDMAELLSGDGTGNLFLSQTCPHCWHEWNKRQLIDPAELLDLVEKAENKEKDDWNPIKRAIYRGDVIDAIEQYLSGDPSALKKLEGVE